MFPGAPQSDYNSNVYLWRPANPGGTVQLPSGFTTVDYHGSWGTRGPNDRLYWLAGLLCDCLDEKVGAGLSPTDRWGPAFGGLHMFTGFASGAAYSAGAFPKAFARNILGVSGPPETILSAWLNASTSTNEGTAAAMGAHHDRQRVRHRRLLHRQGIAGAFHTGLADHRLVVRAPVAGSRRRFAGFRAVQP
jgi:hypothetical protein